MPSRDAAGVNVFFQSLKSCLSADGDDLTGERKQSTQRFKYPPGVNFYNCKHTAQLYLQELVHLHLQKGKSNRLHPKTVRYAWRTRNSNTYDRALALKGLATAKVRQMGGCTLLTQDDKGSVWTTGGGREALRDGGCGSGARGALLVSTPCHSTEFPHSFQPLMYHRHVRAFLSVRFFNEFLNLGNIRWSRLRLLWRAA